MLREQLMQFYCDNNYVPLRAKYGGRIQHLRGLLLLGS